MARDGGGGIGTVITWAAILGGGYFIYNWWQSQQTPAPASTTPAAPPPPPTPTAAANSSAPTLAPSSNVSILDSWYGAMVNAAKAAGYTVLNPDQWGYYFAQVTGFAAPDPLQAFPSFNRATNWPNITSAQYWTFVSPIVAQQKGLAGLGVLAGLGRIAMGGRR